MSQTPAKRRAKRKFEKDGGKNLPAVTISDYEAWIAILGEEGLLPNADVDDVDQIRKATQFWIKDLCRDWRREQANKLIHARVGVLEREKDLPPPEPAHMLSTRFSAGGHWSYKPGQKRDRGRKLTRVEIAAFVQAHPELLNGGLDGLSDPDKWAILGLDDYAPDECEDVVGEDGHRYTEVEE